MLRNSGRSTSSDQSARIQRPSGRRIGRRIRPALAEGLESRIQLSAGNLTLTPATSSVDFGIPASFTATLTSPYARGDLLVSNITINGVTNGQIQEFNTSTNALIGTFATGRSPNGIAFGPDGNLYVNNSASRQLGYY